LTVETVGNGADRPYIQSVSWNGNPYRKSWIRHADLIGGGTLTFHMGAQPNTGFGATPEDRPPSFA